MTLHSWLCAAGDCLLNFSDALSLPPEPRLELEDAFRFRVVFGVELFLLRLLGCFSGSKKAYNQSKVA